MMIPRTWRWGPSIAGGAFLTLLVTTLFVYDNVVFDQGPEVLVGRAVGAPCTDSEECSAPLGSATRRAVPKACVVVDRGSAVCALSCGGEVSCPRGSRCVDSEVRVDGATQQIHTRTCQPERSPAGEARTSRRSALDAAERP